VVDIKKRNALKVLGGTAVISSVPAFAAASENIFDVNGEAVALDETVVPVNASSDLSIALSVDPEPTVTLTNNSNKPLVVRHVHPGQRPGFPESVIASSVCKWPHSRVRIASVKS